MITTHIIFFKSLRDNQQIEYLGKQLNCLQLLKEAYKLSTVRAYGHLIIDLDPKTSHGLRLSSCLIGPEPSLSYIPSEEVVVTPNTNEKEKLAYAEALVHQQQPQIEKQENFLSQIFLLN